MKRLLLLLLIAALTVPALAQFSTVSCTHGETGVCRQATTCSQANVQAAITASSAGTDGYISPTSSHGDGVYIPAGACSWSSGVSWTDKNIGVIGGVGGTTTITASNDAFEVSVTNAAGNGTTTAAAFRISNLTISGGHPLNINTSNPNMTTFAGYFRFDNVTYNTSAGGNAIIIYGPVYGVFDHLNGTANGGNHFEEAMFLNSEFPATSSLLLGETVGRTFAIGLGDRNAVYIESSTFNCAGAFGSGAISDSESGPQRMVFRDNTVTGSCFHYAHWTRSGEWDGGRIEIYNNNYTCGGSGCSGGYPGRFDAGTGVIFNNTLTGYGTTSFQIDEARGCGAQTGGIAGECVGSPPGNSQIDVNAGDTNAPGWPCAGQVGTACTAGGCARSGMNNVPFIMWNNGAQTGCSTGGSCTNSYSFNVDGPPGGAGCTRTMTNYLKSTAHSLSGSLNGAIDFFSGASKPSSVGIYTAIASYTPFTFPYPTTTSVSTVATPTASPVAGTYTGSQTITLSTATGGATICYTTDGSTPTANGAGTCTHGTTYSGTFVVTPGTTVVKAVGSLSGDTDSGVFSGTYVIIPPTLTKIVILPPTTGYYLATNASTAQLTPQCFDATATVMTCPSLTWYSGDTTNATVNGTGLVTGTGVSSVTTGIYITAYAPSKSASVTAYAIASNAITVTATNTFAVNDPVTLAGFSTSTFLNNQTVIVTAATGSTFTAQFIHANTSATESGNANLYVLGRSGVLMPTYTPSGLVTSVGDQVVIGSGALVSARDSTGRPLGDFCAWTSSDPTKATVNYIGEVKGIAVGSVTMTCTIGANTSTGTFNVTNPASTSTTWYVRPGGGTRWDAAVTSGQCNGKFDVDYPGSGTNQNCAFNEVMYLFTDETSSSACTQAAGPGDTAIVRGGPYYINRRQNGTQWVGCQNGTIAPPNGPTGQPFRLLGENWASPTVGRNNPGNATKLISPASVAPAFSIGEQNIDIESFDINLQQDCNPGLNNLSFACPSGNNHPFIFISNNFASNITIKNVRGHGATTFWTGIPGLNVQFINTFSEYNFLDGYNFDDPFGDSQYRTDGFTGIGIEAYCAGCTEEQPKPVTSVSRSGGNITVVFPSTSVVNYVAPAGANPGTNLVLTGMTPSDLNGTYPVNAITFNQQTVSITGGSVIADPDGSVPFLATYTTSTPAAFAIGAFVNITGLTPSFVNGTYEVSNVLSNEFQIWVSPVSRPGWTTATITGTGSASTANTVVATASGSTENATVVGTAGHVFQNHRMFDQFTGAFANGDCIGSGANTIGDWSFNGFYFQDCLQDGLDDLHGSVRSVTVLNGYVEGAEGAPVKLGNADFVTMKGNVLVSNGAKLIAFDPNLAPDANQYVSTTYRAGDVFVMSSHPWSREIITNNSWISGGFNVIWDDFCTQAIGCTTPFAGGYYIAQNNIFRGFTDTNNSVWNSSLPTVYFPQGGNVPWLFQFNMSSSTRNPPSGGTGNQWTTDPLIVTPIPNITTFAGEVNAQSNNLNLTGSSPAIGAGLQNFGVPASDNVGTTMSNPPPIGGLMLASTPTVATPTFSPVAGAYGPSQSVAISTVTGGASIIYTNDGTTPTVTALTCTITHGTLYTGAVTVSTSQTLNAIGCETGFNASSMGTAAYVINGAVANPTCTPAAGTYGSAQSVTCTSSTGGSATVCTIDGSTPNHGSPTCTSISVASSLTLKALSFESGWSDSSVVSNAYAITVPTVATPTASPAAGTYTSTQSVTLSDATSGASICYTTDGTTPAAATAGTCSHGTTYSGAISVPTTTTIKALGTKVANTNSSVASFLYTITPPAPTGMNFNGVIINGTVNH